MGTMGPRWAVAVTGTLGLLAAGCGIDSGDDGVTSTVAQPAPDESGNGEAAGQNGDAPVAEPQPAAPTPTVAEEGPARRLLVYATEVREEEGEGRDFPVDRVVVYDVGAGEETGAFEFGGLDQYPVGVAPAGEDLVVATEPRVWVVDERGDELAVLHDDPLDQVSSLAVSPDGSLAAIALPGAFTDRVGQVLVFDVGSGDVVLRLSSDDEALADFVGDPGRVRWARPTGDALSVEGFTYSEVSGGFALLPVDGLAVGGTVDVLPWGSLTPAPDLRHAVLSDASCFNLGATVEVVDLRAQSVVATVGVGRQLLRGIRWAPDSSRVLMELHPPVDSEEECFTLGDAGWQAVVADPIAGTVTAVDDRAAFEAEWDSEQGYRVDCPFEPKQRPECALVVDGIEIARGRPPSGGSMVVGVIE